MRLAPFALALALAASAACSGDGTSASDTHGDATAPPGPIVINELFVTGAADWVELHNRGEVAVDLAGYVFRDDNPERGYTFPPETVLAPGGYLVLPRGEGGFDFGLGVADAALLYDADGAFADGVTWIEGEIPPGRSYGRLPDGVGPFTALFVASPGAPNVDNPEVVCGDGAIGWTELCDGDALGGVTCASFGFGGGALACVDCVAFDTSGCAPPTSPVVINEVSSSGDDLIELLNRSDDEIDLSRWSLRDDDDNAWVFPADRRISAGAYLVLRKGLDHDFGLGAEDGLELRDPDGVVRDRCAWGAGAADVSYCRVPDGVGGFRACPAASFGAPNPTP